MYKSINVHCTYLSYKVVMLLRIANKQSSINKKLFKIKAVLQL